ncbi:prolactin receptor b [Cololabis saira]|uniref:prolactin receptor b n=1 Tax=Cololabis saira TaxID=129043 RepID=UPI002AD3186A|nr:prolactin receptor b [Cololabis saira]
MSRALGLVMLFMLSAAEFNGPSRPGKPVWIECRSPEKETFTCRWRPGSDGGLPTVHRLYYERDGLNAILECPDYQSEGSNSCFFDKNHTSLWVEYSLTVVASNDLGNSTSDPLKIDVAKIVKPHPPQNVTMLVKQNNDIPYLHIRWKKPPKTDIRSGWVTLEYQLRVKQEDKEWKKIDPVKETTLDLYSMVPGAAYTVQVRCSVDHGQWSEWSNNTTVQVPNSPLSETSLMLLGSMLSLIPLLATICILIVKRKTVKQWLLPPVPGPKIKGVDVHLLKSGGSEDITKALMGDQALVPAPTWTDQAEEYLIVSDGSDWLLPDPDTSGKKKKCTLIPASFHFHSETKCEKLTSGKNSRDETDQFATRARSQSEENSGNVEPPEPTAERRSSVNSGDKENPNRCRTGPGNGLQTLANTSYVDIQEHVDMKQQDYSRVKEVDGQNGVVLEKENPPVRPGLQKQGDVAGDYSRVKEVDSDTVFLQKHQDSAHPGREKDDHDAERTPHKPKKPHGAQLSTERLCSGYVDSVPNFPVP